MHSVRILAFLLVLALLGGCGNNKLQDLNPSGTNEVPAAQPGTTGPLVGELAPNFTLSDIYGNNVTLSSVYPTVSGVVLFFSMWCPICDFDLNNMVEAVIPSFPNVRFFVIDYVSGSVANALGAVQSNGFAGAPFTVLVDINDEVYNSYAANMGTTVVIDSTGVIRMNEDYEDGSRLVATLQALP